MEVFGKYLLGIIVFKDPIFQVETVEVVAKMFSKFLFLVFSNEQFAGAKVLQELIDIGFIALCYQELTSRNIEESCTAALFAQPY